MGYPAAPASAQHLGRGVLGGRGPEEGAGPAGEGGDPVAAALDLRPHRGRRQARERRVAPGVVAQLVAVVGHELGGVRVLREPRADGQHRDGGAPVGQRREDAPGQAEVARAVEGQRDLAAPGRGVDELAGGAAARGSRRRRRRARAAGHLRRGHGPRGARHRRHAAGRAPHCQQAPTARKPLRVRRQPSRRGTVHQALTWEFLYLETPCSARRRRLRSLPDSVRGSAARTCQLRGRL